MAKSSGKKAASDKKTASSKGAEDSGRKAGKIVSFVLLLIIIVVLGALAYVVMRSFILPMFLAALLVVIFQPVDRWINQFCKQRRRIAAMLTTTVILLVVLVPIIWVITMGVTEAAKLAQTDGDRVTEISGKLDGFRERFGMQVPFESELDALQLAINRVTSADNATGFEANSDDAQTLKERIKQMQLALDDTLQAPTTDRRKRMRVEAAVDSLQAMKANAEEICASVRDGDRAAESPPAIDCNLAIEALADSYRAFRFELLGGFPWATLIETANPRTDQIRKWQTNLAREARGWLLYLGGEAGGFIASFSMGLAVMILAIYYFLVDGPDMIRTAMRLSPLDDTYEAELLNEFSSVSRAVVLATLLSAVGQGLLAGFGYWVCDLHPLFLLTILTTLLAMVPFVGAAAIWVPATVYLGFIAEDRMGAAIFLGIWGFAVVSMADNLIKPFVLHGQSKLHPLLALLSVIGGVQALGPVGLLVGPMIVSFLQALLNMLQKEISALETR